MGYEDREYYRAEGEGRFFAPGGSAVKALLAINIAVFLGQVLSTDADRFAFGDFVSQWTALIPSAVGAGEVWRVLTYGFGYAGSPLKFLFDMYFLWMFGKAVEELYGTRELSFFYVAGTVVPAVACLIGSFAFNRNLSVLGSEVPATAVLVLYAWHHPRTQVLLFFLIPVEIWLLVTGYVLLNFANAALSDFGEGQFVAYLVGVGFALLYAKSGWRIENGIPAGRPKLRLPRRKPKLRVFEPEGREDLDRKVDEILAKIHEQGEASLTDRERKTLQEASRRYKKT